MDIIEHTDASPEVREICELNVGAYVARASALFATLKTLPPSSVDGDYRLTDCAHRLIHAGKRVNSYRIYDEGEVLGINTHNDLEQAAFVLQKRLYRPRRNDEQNVIAFGTGGWRAVIGEGFTLHNVRRLSQALANAITRRGDEKRGVLIGYDRRFLSDRSAEAAAEVFAGNNILHLSAFRRRPHPARHVMPRRNKRRPTGLPSPPVTTPARMERSQGLPGDGAFLPDAETRQIEAEANRLQPQDCGQD
jgi:hypothetical protein